MHRVTFLTLLATACTEYELGGPEPEPTADPTVPTATPTVPVTVPPATEPVEPTEPEVDPTTPTEPEVEEPDYCTPFDDFADWNQDGEGAWRVENGLLGEGRNGEYDAIAWLHDLGSADHFGVQVDMAWSGNANDLAGVVWGYDGEEGYAVRWDDPQDHYQRYEPPGALDLSSCAGSDCTQIVVNAGADLTHPADMSFVTFLAEVEHDVLRVSVGGTVVWETQVAELVGTGPGVVGLFSDDNDGGVWFDNFCVWTYEE